MIRFFMLMITIFVFGGCQWGDTFELDLTGSESAFLDFSSSDISNGDGDIFIEQDCNSCDDGPKASECCHSTPSGTPLYCSTGLIMSPEDQEKYQCFDNNPSM